jgi:hypothetical protein
MAVQPCTRDGKPGYRAISPHGEGDCFLYRDGDPGGQARAKAFARQQLVTITARSNDENIQAVIESIECI